MEERRDKMKEFKGIKIPETPPIPEEIEQIQKFQCKNVLERYSDECDGVDLCNDCIYSPKNLDKFKEWYKQ
jgi:hypothetical protein